MAFYSYVMMKNVHVGTEAILHVVREQHDRSLTQMRAPRRLLNAARADRHMVGIMYLSSVKCFPVVKDAFMLIFQMMSEQTETLI